MISGKHLLKSPGNAISESLIIKMSLDALALKNLCLGCEFQRCLLFVISLLFSNFLTALKQPSHLSHLITVVILGTPVLVLILFNTVIPVSAVNVLFPVLLVILLILVMQVIPAILVIPLIIIIPVTPIIPVTYVILVILVIPVILVISIIPVTLVVRVILVSHLFQSPRRFSKGQNWP